MSTRWRSPARERATKERDSIFLRERLHREDVLTGEMEHATARHDDRQTEARFEQLQQEGARHRQTCSKLSSRSSKLSIGRSASEIVWLERLALAFRGAERLRLPPAQRAPAAFTDAKLHQRRLPSVKRLIRHRWQAQAQRRVFPRPARPDEREQPDIGLLDQIAQAAPSSRSRPISCVLIATADEPATASFGVGGASSGSWRRIACSSERSSSPASRPSSSPRARCVARRTSRASVCRSGTVERKHQLHPRLLAQRLLVAQRAEFGEHALVLPKGEPRCQQLLQAREAELLQVARFVGGELGILGIGERSTPPSERVRSKSSAASRSCSFARASRPSARSRENRWLSSVSTPRSSRYPGGDVVIESSPRSLRRLETYC